MITGTDNPYGDLELPEAPRLHAKVSDVANMIKEPIEVPGAKDLRCHWCGGLHTTECWSIMEATFYPDGRWQSVKLLPRPIVENSTIYDESDLV